MNFFLLSFEVLLNSSRLQTVSSKNDSLNIRKHADLFAKSYTNILVEI